MSEQQGPAGDVEPADAERVESAIQTLSAGDVAAALKTLSDVAGRTPGDYQNQYERDGTLYVKFWNVEDFTHFVTVGGPGGTRPEQKVVWLKNAYPKAFYYLGFIAVKQRRPDIAIQHLDLGYRLDGHPMFLAERAKALSMLGRQDEAIASCRTILERGESVTGRMRALALRGIGFQLIERGDLDGAEATFRDSLTLDPDSTVAANELKYIAHLRQGGRSAPTEVVATNSAGPSDCAACGMPLDGGTVFNASGRLIWLCPSCAASVARGAGPNGAPSVKVHFAPATASGRRTPKKWWQFWRSAN